jgi:hypothetical protein
MRRALALCVVGSSVLLLCGMSAVGQRAKYRFALVVFVNVHVRPNSDEPPRDDFPWDTTASWLVTALRPVIAKTVMLTTAPLDDTTKVCRRMYKNKEAVLCDEIILEQRESSLDDMIDVVIHVHHMDHGVQKRKFDIPVSPRRCDKPPLETFMWQECRHEFIARDVATPIRDHLNQHMK